MLMTRYNLYFKRFHGLLTDSAPPMVASKAGLVSKIRSEVAFMHGETHDSPFFFFLHNSPGEFVHQVTQI